MLGKDPVIAVRGLEIPSDSTQTVRLQLEVVFFQTLHLIQEAKTLSDNWYLQN